MSPSAEHEHLPQSVGGLIDFAYASFAAHAPLYVLLAAAAFAVQALLEYAIPAARADSTQGALKEIVLLDTAVFVDALVIAAVAVGAGARLAGTSASGVRITAAAVERWLPLVAIGIVIQLVEMSTYQLSALGALPDPPWLAVLTAPLVWLVWGMLALALPIAALSGKRPLHAVFEGLWQSMTLSAHPANFGRLCFVAFVSIVPSLLQAMAVDAALQHHVPRPFFWANVPIDALTVGPLAALQTAFALDFARRAGRLEQPPRAG